MIGMVVIVWFPPLDPLLFDIFGKMLFTHLPQECICTVNVVPFAYEVVEPVQLFC